MRHIGPCRNIPSHLIPARKQPQLIPGLFLHRHLRSQDFTLMQLSNVEEQFEFIYRKMAIYLMWPLK